MRKSKIKAQHLPSFLVTSGDSGEVELQWDPVFKADLYIVQYCSFSWKKLKWIQVDIVTRTYYTISGLRSGKKYCFRISAVNETGQGPWSIVAEHCAP